MRSSLFTREGSYLGAANALYAAHPELAKPNQLRSYIKSEVTALEPDLELLTETVRLAKGNQKLQDIQRIERKAFREHARIENAVTAYNEAIVNELQAIGGSLRGCERRSGPLDPDASVLVVHLSDNHFQRACQPAVQSV